MKSMMKKIIGVVSIFAIVGLVCAGATFANYETGKMTTNYETTDPCELVINDPDSVGWTGTDLYKVDSDSYKIDGTVTSSPSALPVLPAVTDSYSVDGTVTDPASSSSEPYGTAHWGGAGSTTWSDVIVGEVTDPASLSLEPGYITGDLTTLSEVTDPASLSLDSVTDPDTVIFHDVEASSNIDVEASSNIDVEASSNIDVEASSNIDVEASSNIDVEGSSKIAWDEF